MNETLAHEASQLPPGMVRTIQETLSRIAASLDLQEVLHTITENARQLIGSDIAQVNLYDRETGQAWVGARDDGRPEQPAAPPAPPRPDGLTMQVIRQSAPVIAQDILSHPLFANYKSAREWGIRTLAGFPIKREKVVVGVLMVSFVRPHCLDEQEWNVLELLASQAAVAIENARLFQAEQRQRVLAETLRQVAETISSTLRLDEMMGRVLDQLRRVVDYDSATIFVTKGENGYLSAVTSRGLPEALARTPRVISLKKDDLFRAVAQARSPLVLADAQQDPRWIPEPLVSYVRGWIGVPFLIKGRVVGMLTVDSSQPAAYGPREAKLVELFARQATVAIENAQLFEAEQERRQIAEALGQIASILTSTLDLGKVLELVLDTLRNVVAYDSSAIFLRQGNRLELAIGRGFPESAEIADFSFDIADSALEPIMTKGGRPIVIPDVLTSDRFRRAEGTEYIRSWIGAPLWARGKLVGLLTVDHSQPGMYDEKDAQKVMDFANQAAIVIENARLHMSVQVHAEELEWRVEERTVELRREKEKTETILRSVADGVVVAGLDGKILLANPVASRWLTLSTDGQPSPNCPLRQFIAQLAQNTQLAQVRRVELTLDHKGVILDAHAAWLFEDDAASGIVVVLRDVTRQQELERLKSQFIASISHELRTPLANVKLYLSLLQRGKKEKKARYMQVINQEADRLEELIQDLLDFSSAGAISDESDYEPLRLKDLVRQVMPPFQARADSKGLVIVERFAPDLPPILGDRDQIGRVFYNLLDNALDYTPAGGQITVATLPLTVKAGYCADVSGPGISDPEGLKVPDVPDGEWVGAIVADTGIGILPQDRPYIFERFYRGGQAETMSLPGTGLGLTLIWEILNRHEGHIAVSSVAGEGSLFVIFLPGYSAKIQDRLL